MLRTFFCVQLYLIRFLRSSPCKDSLNDSFSFISFSSSDRETLCKTKRVQQKGRILR